MRHTIQWLRSMVFIAQMYVMMFILALFYTPLALFSRAWAFKAVHAYCGWVRWTARWMIGLDSEIRGTAPNGEVIIASKHQSFFDIIMIVHATQRPKFIMKASLKWAPILGWYAMRMGCVPVDRGKRGAAIARMKADVAARKTEPGQLIIYPQGTRVAPGVEKAYKIGTGVLYEQLGQPCVPAATNVGVFWPRHGIYRKPGIAVVEFLEPIDAGMPVNEFMATLENAVETRSSQLMVEAGYKSEDSN